jgi:peptidoglycan/xylan/chitin deacetylase (PgdA/CDA1 family)
VGGVNIRRGSLALAPVVGAVAVAHALPALTTHGGIRRLTPRLAGEGRPGGIALTFDDGPDPDGTPAVLETLAGLGWRATFFLLGSQVRRYPAIARLVVDAGHEIGVHGAEHRNHLTRTPGAIRRDLRSATREITEATGVVPRWFRPPYGVLSSASLWAAAELGLTPVLWTAWGKDWRAGPAVHIVATVMRDLRDGGTVLLHDSDCTSRPGSWRSTVAALPLLATRLRAQDLDVRTLGEHVLAQP